MRKAVSSETYVGEKMIFAGTRQNFKGGSLAGLSGGAVLF
jgi:hypothetical protein